MEARRKRVLVGVTGSVAAIKVPELIQSLQDIQDPQIEVQVVSTEKAKHFYDPTRLNVKCHFDEDEWKWKSMDDPVLHVELRKWADLMVIAPLDANTMAKMVHGLCDNLLSCVIRAWDPSKPLLFCPAMNTMMWTHPHTASHIAGLLQFGYIEVPPVVKKLACGDEGMGAMASVSDIVQAIQQHLVTKQDQTTT